MSGPLALQAKPKAWGRLKVMGGLELESGRCIRHAKVKEVSVCVGSASSD